MMNFIQTTEYRRSGLIFLVVMLIVLSFTLAQGSCNDPVQPNAEPFPPGGYIGGISPFAPVDPNQGSPCPFPADSSTGDFNPFPPGGYIGSVTPFPQVDPNQGSPCPFDPQSSTGSTAPIQAIMNTAGSNQCSSGSTGATGTQGSTSQGSSSGPVVVQCPLYPGLNGLPTTAPTPAPTIVPQPAIKAVPQEPGQTKFTSTGWSDISYKMPTDPDKDGLFEDLNGDSHTDFSDVILLFRDLEWIQANEPVQYFDFDGDNKISFGDVIALFKKLP